MAVSVDMSAYPTLHPYCDMKYKTGETEMGTFFFNPWTNNYRTPCSTHIISLVTGNVNRRLIAECDDKLQRG